MCGRYSLATDPAPLVSRLGVQFREFHARYNIAPTQTVRVIRRSPDSNTIEATPMRWGLVPFWSKDDKIGARMINARSETAAGKPSFRQPFRSRRCLVPADGFYEWQPTPAGKQPWRFVLHPETPFAFAGLWDAWHHEGTTLLSFTILTTNANPLVAAVHDRMPVILAPGDDRAWLDADASADALQSLLHPFPQDQMRGFRVSRRVSSPANDTPDCITPTSPDAAEI